MGIFQDRQEAELTCLDLLNAFNNVNNEILIDKLYYYGIGGVSAELMKSYLDGRGEQVEWNNKLCHSRNVKHGVP